MQIANIRFMSLGNKRSSSTRADVLLPKPVNGIGYMSTQAHVPIAADSTPEDIRAAVSKLQGIVNARGFSLDECSAPPMLTGCFEPPEHLQAAIKEALA